ncbi:MAG TPA: hypothetical protein VIA18_16595 [Polyangia bacterium]|jgi:hypothetical protein|nr:hypothetical protein [Polyangia bacterium]
MKPDLMPNHERRTTLIMTAFVVAMAALFAALAVTLAHTMKAY